MSSIVIGANRGIGLELVKLCKGRGPVVAVCRSPSPELTATGVQIESGIDVTSDGDVKELAQRLDGTRFDLLIHNAGILKRVGLDNLDFDEIRRQFEVNALGPLRVVAALAPLLNKGAKIGLLTSRMGSIADNSSGGHYAYRMSKAALNMAGVSLAHDLKSKELSVAILHPGFVRTDMTAGAGNVDAPEAAAGLIQRIDELSLDSSGTFWHANGERLPW